MWNYFVMNPLPSRFFYFTNFLSDFTTRGVWGRVQSNLQWVINEWDHSLQMHFVLTKPLSALSLPVRPYDGKWSKTMVGFGPEADHFVAELTYNYGVGEYQLGNDFLVGESGFGLINVWGALCSKEISVFLLGSHSAVQPSSEQCQTPWVAPDSGGGSSLFNPGSRRISFLHRGQRATFSRWLSPASALKWHHTVVYPVLQYAIHPSFNHLCQGAATCSYTE